MIHVLFHSRYKEHCICPTELYGSSLWDLSPVMMNQPFVLLMTALLNGSIDGVRDTAFMTNAKPVLYFAMQQVIVLFNWCPDLAQVITAILAVQQKLRGNHCDCWPQQTRKVLNVLDLYNLVIEEYWLISAHSYDGAFTR